MKFEDAMDEMRQEKQVYRKGWNRKDELLSIIPIMVWNKCKDRTAIELTDADIMAEDWEILE